MSRGVQPVIFSSLRRLGQIGAVVVLHLLAHAAGVMFARWPRLARRLSLSRLSGPARVRAAFEDLGGTFIKFGQMLALQPDIISLDYCDALFDLLDRCSPADYAYVERTFIEETGKKPGEIFEAFDQQPIATASIGQVHVARLQGGRKVAVKVQRPRVDTDFVGDIRLIEVAIKFIKHLHLWFLFWMLEPMTEFVAWTTEELDYRSEARYMEQLRSNARNNPNEYIPTVFREYSTRRILVTEFLEGETVMAYIRARENNDELMLHRLKTSGFDEVQVARNIINNFLGDAFQHGVFHADLHPANLLILPHNVIGYCDMGICGLLNAFDRNQVITLTLAYTRGDIEGMCEGFLRVATVDRKSNVRRFREGLRELAASWYDGSNNRRTLRKTFTLVMLDMLRLSRATLVCPERNIIKYIRSSIAVDGLIMRFAPGFDVGRHLESVCADYLKWHARKSLLTYETVVGWASSGQQLIQDGPFRIASLLQRFASGELRDSRYVSGADTKTDSILRRKTVQLGAFVFAISLIINLTGEPVRFGINLFTAELLLIASATVTLLRTVRRFS